MTMPSQHPRDQTFELVPLERLQPHPRNPRRGDLTAIRASLDTHGWFGAVLAQRSTGWILAGNHRFLAAQQQGLQTIPVLWIDLDDESALRILLADNRTSDRAGYDDDALANLLNELLEQTGTLVGTGFDSEELDSLLERLANPAESAGEPLESADQSRELVERHAVLVSCESEERQLELLKRFTEEGLNCRALVA